MDIADLKQGICIEFSYPRHNVVGFKSDMERRRLRIDRVRRLSEEPLDPFTKENQPLLRRGENLVIGLDLDKRAQRGFYWENMTDVRLLPESELAMEEPHTVSVGDRVVFRGAGFDAAAFAVDCLKERSGQRVSIDAA